VNSIGQDPPFVTVENYLAAHYPDGDREYVGGVVVERNAGTPGHSALQKILTVHLGRLRTDARDCGPSGV
jgi:hypothetical protein